MINKLKKLKKGFTLVEMLVAVLLLTTALAGPLTIASRGLTASIAAKDQVTAFFLAQDAVEFVRFVRDTNRLKGYYWLRGLDGDASIDYLTISGSGCMSADGLSGCYVDTRQGIINQCSQGNCNAPLNYDFVSGWFTLTVISGQALPTPQSFRRSIKIKNDGVSNEALLTVTITWCNIAASVSTCTVGSQGVHTVSVREVLFNWQ